MHTSAIQNTNGGIEFIIKM